MTRRLRWSGSVLAGLGWVFLARLAQDPASSCSLQLPLSATPLVVCALLLPFRAGAVALTLVLLLHDAGRPVPFGLSATLALPAYVMLFRIRRHLARESAAVQAGLALALTPALHVAQAVALTLAGRLLPADTLGFLTEILAGAALAALFTPWLGVFMPAVLARFGVRLEREEVES